MLNVRFWLIRNERLGATTNALCIGVDRLSLCRLMISSVQLCCHCFDFVFAQLKVAVERNENRPIHRSIDLLKPSAVVKRRFSSWLAFFRNHSSLLMVLGCPFPPLTCFFFFLLLSFTWCVVHCGILLPFVDVVFVSTYFLIYSGVNSCASTFT